MKPKRDPMALVNKLAEQERSLVEARFLAPCVASGRVRARVAGLVYTFAVDPGHFEGWGIFQAHDPRVAALEEEADPVQVAEYLGLLQPVRLRLAAPLSGRTWLAYPVNESDARQRLGKACPLPVHLVDHGLKLEQVVARNEGGCLWFEEVDRRADPTEGERLRTALSERILPEQLAAPGLTPEMRVAYDLCTQSEAAFAALFEGRRTEERLRRALRLGGGTLQSFLDRGEHWVVDWTDTQGTRHSSAISKGDLTVISAGICLAGRDRDFDLQSLVGVMEGY
ncbi:MAG: hypothetical protein AB1758_25810 [Candidatus Eremiobacterota bacterium]